MDFRKKKKESSNTESWMQLLPPKIRVELEALGNSIEDATVSREEFIERSLELQQRVEAMPKAIQNAFQRVVKLLAERERTERRKSGEQVPDAPSKADLEEVRDSGKM